MKLEFKEKLKSKINVKLPTDKKFVDVTLNENEILLIEPFISKNTGGRMWSSMDADEFLNVLFDNNIPNVAVTHANLIKGDLDGKKGIKPILDKWKEEGLI